MDEETKRQLTHLTVGNFFIVYLALNGWLPTLKIATAFLLLWIFIYFYSRNKGRHKVLHNFLQIFERKNELQHPGRAPLVFLSAVVLLLLIFHNVSVLIGALVMLAYGDSFSTIIGKKFGRIKIQNRTLEGTVGGFIISAILLYFYYKNAQIAIITAAIGMMAEYLPLDDNFTVPIISALVLATVI